MLLASSPLKLSLSELRKLHANSGRRPLAITPQGHVDVLVRNADGSVDQAESKSNLATGLWDAVSSSIDPYANQRTQHNLFILPNDNGEMNVYRTAARHLYPENYEVAVDASVNTTTATWTWTAVFSAPSQNRVFRYVGLKDRSSIGGDNVGRSVTYIYAMTKLTADISQSTTQTLEVVYRVSFSRA